MAHTVVHFEIPASDPEKLADFYRQLFGWQIQKMEGMDYWFIQTVPVDAQGRPTEPGVNGGVMRRQAPEHPPTNYLEVGSVDEFAGRVQSLGGRLVVPKQAVPHMGFFAICLDPDGNVFGLWEGNPQAA